LHLTEPRSTATRKGGINHGLNNKQALGDRIETTESDASPTRSIPLSSSSTNIAPNSRIKNVDSDSSFLTSTPKSQTTPHSATEQPSDLAQAPAVVRYHQQTVHTASEISLTLSPQISTRTTTYGLVLCYLQPSRH
jgi:hypothetical protein